MVRLKNKNRYIKLILVYSMGVFLGVLGNTLRIDFDIMLKHFFITLLLSPILQSLSAIGVFNLDNFISMMGTICLFNALIILCIYFYIKNNKNTSLIILFLLLLITNFNSLTVFYNFMSV